MHDLPQARGPMRDLAYVKTRLQADTRQRFRLVMPITSRGDIRRDSEQSTTKLAMELGGPFKPTNLSDSDKDTEDDHIESEVQRVPEDVQRIIRTNWVSCMTYHRISNVQSVFNIIISFIINEMGILYDMCMLL